MMLQARLFDDSPHTREIIYNFMRLHALPAEVDVKLALSEFTLEQAGKHLEEKFRWTQTQHVKKQSPFPRALAKPSLIKLANSRRI
jgi:hypothetical protein